MTSLPVSLARAFAQLMDRRVLRLLLKSLLVTVVLFVAAAAGIYLLITWLLADQPAEISQGLGALGFVLALVFGGWLLFRVTALAAIQFFADDVVEAVEARYYPQALEDARRIGFAESIGISAKGAVRVILVNIAILPLAVVLLVTGFGTVILFALVNAWLLGRELRDMAWLRHRHDRTEQPPIGRGTRFALGLVIAVMLIVPGLNFIAPIIGAAAATHLVQGGLRSA